MQARNGKKRRECMANRISHKKIRLHIICTALTSPVTRICSLSLQSKVFPSAWKLHKICPIPKKGDLRIVNNYRPISLLPILSKVLETCRKYCIQEDHWFYATSPCQVPIWLPEKSIVSIANACVLLRYFQERRIAATN